MYSYSFRELRSKWYVIDIETGCSLPYNNGKLYDFYSIPEYKRHEFTAWFQLSRSARKRMKKEHMIAGNSISITTCDDFWSITPLAPLPATKPSYPQACCEPKQMAPRKAKGKKAMRYDYDLDAYVSESEDQTKRAYLQNRLEGQSYAKDIELQKQFGLMDDDAPTTPTELVERIKEGKYAINKEYEDKKVYDPARYIRWRDPSVKEDKEGYTLALKAKDKASTATLDQIKIANPEAALKALQDFEAATFH